MKLNYNMIPVIDNIKSLARWKIIFLISFLTCLLSGSHAFANLQNSKRHFYGGHFGIELGLVNQYEVAGIIGYRMLPRWDAGIGIKYQYYNNRRLNEMFRAHLYAPLVYTDFVIIRDLDDFLPFSFIDGPFFIHAQMDYFYLPADHFDLKNEHTGNRFFRPTWLTGAGIRRFTGSNSFFQLLIMMDISGHGRSVYSNPVIRFGLFF